MARFFTDNVFQDLSEKSNDETIYFNEADEKRLDIDEAEYGQDYSDNTIYPRDRQLPQTGGLEVESDDENDIYESGQINAFDEAADLYRSQNSKQRGGLELADSLDTAGIFASDDYIRKLNAIKHRTQEMWGGMGLDDEYNEPKKSVHKSNSRPNTKSNSRPSTKSTTRSNAKTEKSLKSASFIKDEDAYILDEESDSEDDSSSSPISISQDGGHFDEISAFEKKSTSNKSNKSNKSSSNTESLRRALDSLRGKD